MAQPPADFEIRPVTRAEAEAWRTLRLEMLRDEPLAFSSSYEDQVELELDFFAARIPNDGVDALFGVYVDGVLSGSAGFSREEGAKVAHKGVMWSVYLRPHLRGTGIAQALIGRLIEHARDHVAQLHCSVSAANGRAGALYRRLGFVDYGREPRALRIGGVDYDEELLVITFD